MLRSEGNVLGAPTSKEAALDRKVKREELGCPSPGPRWSKSPQLGSGEGIRTSNSRKWLVCSHNSGGGGGRGGAVSRQEGLKVQRGHPEGGAVQEAL